MMYCTTSINLVLGLIFTIYYNEQTSNPFYEKLNLKHSKRWINSV